MTYKEKVLAALAEFRRDSLGVVAATIEDCEAIVEKIQEEEDG